MAELEHVDVLVVGAGISGIGAAYHLQTQVPGTSFAVLEALESFGGTWLVHTYPGVRSDSDLYTFGYRFKPWVGPPIATRDEIRTYLGEVIEENDLGQHIRYRHKITGASWSSEDARWTVTVSRLDDGSTFEMTAGFLWMCQGYYNHAQGYTPPWEGFETFEGEVIHPQTWPEDVSLAGKRVVVIGSGATAATLLPNIADDCEHVTMLQRSPTYFFARPNANELVDQLRALDVDPMWIHEIARKQALQMQGLISQMSLAAPDMVKAELIKNVEEQLPDGFDMTHFTPSYRPWQQRIAMVPNGDLFAAIRSGKASVVTDEIERFEPAGIRLASGELLEADVVITATGFDLSVMGDIPFSVDGSPVSWSDTVTYRGMMFTGVPNLLWVFGYFRASWTLRVDLMGDFVARLLSHMRAAGATTVVPQLRDEDAMLPRLSWIDPENFNPGYLMRSVDLLPRRLDAPEWQHTQDYWTEKDVIPAAPLDDGCLRFS
ncbi:MAG TPA: NAD(P)/FAD-dependent oxidoreductase [Acidimicrobiales bacterium]|nr:NAD(P)/FAD-dependent oxidoreductase [Acidimicrobiales bacterium]